MREERDLYNNKLELIGKTYFKDDKCLSIVNGMYDDNALDDEDIEKFELNKEKDGFKI